MHGGRARPDMLQCAGSSGPERSRMQILALGLQLSVRSVPNRCFAAARWQEARESRRAAEIMTEH